MNRGLYSFWFTNHWLEENEMRWQLNEMQQKGFSGVLMHPRDGLLIPWNTEKWFESVAVALDQCKKNNMELWLYDEDPYPSGVAGGRVFLDHPEYLARHMSMTELKSDGGEVIFDFPAGQLIGVTAVNNSLPEEDNWLDLTAYTGIVRTRWTDPIYRQDGYYMPYTEQGTAHWRANTSGINYRTAATLPAGEWRIFAFTSQVSGWGRWGNYTDILNPKAIEYFINVAYEPYRERFSQDFGKAIPGVFTDEPSLTGTHPWSPVFADYFMEQYGYDIRRKLPHLYHTFSQESAVVRFHYRQALGRLYRSSYIRQVAGWCKENNLLFTGHMSPEEDPIRQTITVPYLLSQLKEMSVPGTDLINGNIGGSAMPLLHLGPKFPSSAARHTGKNNAIVEAYGANNWDTSLATLKKMTDWLFVLGITDVVCHGQYYSVDGLRKKEAPPSYFYQSASWKDFSSFSGYLNKLSGLIKEGERVCRVLMYYPQATFSCLLSQEEEQEAHAYRHALGELVHTLLSCQWDFDIADEETLQEYTVNGQKLTGKYAEYDVLIVPSSPFIEESTAIFINKAIEQGLPVLATHKIEAVVDGSSLPPDLPILTAEEITHKLERIIKRAVIAKDLAGNAAKGYLQTRNTGGGMRVFFVNEMQQAQDIVFSADELQENLTLCLPAGESILLDITKNGIEPLLLCGREAQYILPYLQTKSTDKKALTDWQLMAKDQNVFPLAFWQRSTDKTTLDLSQKPDAMHEEAISYHADFILESAVSPVFLVHELSGWEGEGVLSVNGTELKSFERVRRYDTHNYEGEISSLLNIGQNRIELTFANGGRMCEPLRLFGDFMVKENTISTMPKQIEASSVCSWDKLGLPYYAGTVEYKTKAGSLDKNTWLVIEQVADSAAIVVNGKEYATLHCAPYAWDISQAVDSQQENEISIFVTGNSAALLETRVVPYGITGGIYLRSI